MRYDVPDKTDEQPDSRRRSLMKLGLAGLLACAALPAGIAASRPAQAQYYEDDDDDDERRRRWRRERYWRERQRERYWQERRRRERDWRGGRYDDDDDY